MRSCLEVGYIASETSQRHKGQDKPRLQPLPNFRGQSSSPKFYSYIFDLIVSVPTDQERAYDARRPRLRLRSRRAEAHRSRFVDPAAKIAQRIQNQWNDTRRTSKQSPHRSGSRRRSRVSLDSKWRSHLGSFRTDGRQPHHLGLGGSDGLIFLLQLPFAPLRKCC